MPGILSVSLVAGNKETLSTPKLGAEESYSKEFQRLVNESSSDT